MSFSLGPSEQSAAKVTQELAWEPFNHVREGDGQNPVEGFDPHVAKKKLLSKIPGADIVLHWNTWEEAQAGNRDSQRRQEIFDELGTAMYLYFCEFYQNTADDDRGEIFSALKQDSNAPTAEYLAVKRESNATLAQCKRELESMILNFLEGSEPCTPEVLLSLELDDLNLETGNLCRPLKAKQGLREWLVCFQWCAKLRFSYKPTPTTRYPSSEIARIVCGVYFTQIERTALPISPGSRHIIRSLGSGDRYSAETARTLMTGRSGTLHSRVAAYAEDQLMRQVRGGFDGMSILTRNTPTMDGALTRHLQPLPQWLKTATEDRERKVTATKRTMAGSLAIGDGFRL
ncbi:hypothetical protein QFC20_005014 [Naganishia adeliensis]|uniref:Uncharacterized protein n=1 Tax=Naganishia adeliensis TaxID=92952 RepID=A0ACC2VT67_9TREE|nr:hypothetical protein QFC20_005014 [Naganishia adeliensis]